LGEIKVGDTAPDFTLPTDGGGEVKLSDLKGQAVVLYFYPKDDTSGCTVEALEFTALSPAFTDVGATVVGISADSVRSHDKFKTKHNLTIRLAADTEKDVVQRYGVWVKKSKYGREYMGIERSTALVDRTGKIAAFWRKVTAKGHAEEVLEAVKKLS
jgi:peroxiredoxin Q/BCP